MSIRIRLVIYSTIVLCFGVAFLLWQSDLWLPVDEILSPTTQRGFTILSLLSGTAGVVLLIGRRQVGVAVSYRLSDAKDLWQESIIGMQQQWDTTSIVIRSVLFVSIGVGIWQRLRFLDQPIRTDEAWTYLTYASQPLYLALSDYSAPNNHLFHTFWVSLSTMLFGSAEWAIRLPAFICGILLIPATYAVISLLYNREAAVLTAALIAVSSPLIEYAVNARGYTLQTLLILLAIIVAYHIIHEKHNAVRYALLSGLSALIVYTIPTGIYALSGIWLWIVWHRVQATDRTQWRVEIGRIIGYGLLSILMALVLYTPVFIVTGLSSVTGNTYVTAQALPDFLSDLGEMLLRTFQQWHAPLGLPMMILSLIGIIAAMIFRDENSKASRIPLLLLIIVCGLLLVSIQRVAPFRRVWLFLLPLYFGMSAAGWWYLLTKRLPVRYAQMLLMGAIVVYGAAVHVTRSPYLSIETGTFRDAEAVIETLAPQLDSDTDKRIIYEHPSGESLVFYARLQGLSRNYLGQGGLTNATEVYVVLNTEYPQTIDSVFRVNRLNQADYTNGEHIATLPLAEIYRFTRLPEDD